MLPMNSIDSRFFNLVTRFGVADSGRSEGDRTTKEFKAKSCVMCSVGRSPIFRMAIPATSRVLVKTRKGGYLVTVSQASMDLLGRCPSSHGITSA